MNCRRKEIGEAYWMHEYTYIATSVYILRDLIEAKVPYGGLDSEGLPNLRTSIERNLDETLSCLLSDSELIDGVTFIQALEKWNLKDEFDKAVELYNKLINNPLVVYDT